LAPTISREGGGEMNWLQEEKGMALVTVLLAASTFLLLSTAALQLANTETMIAANHRSDLEALNIAEAGVTDALSRLNAGEIIPAYESGWSQTVSGSLIGGEYEVELAPVLDSEGQVLQGAVTIASTGFSGSAAEYRARKTVSATARAQLESIFQNAIATKARSDVTGAGLTFGENNDVTGDIFVDGDVVFTGLDNDIDGTIRTTGEVTEELGWDDFWDWLFGGDNDVEAVVEGAEPQNFPPLDLDRWQGEAQAGGYLTTGSFAADPDEGFFDTGAPFVATLSSCYREGDLSFTGPGTVNLADDPVIWVNGDLTLDAAHFVRLGFLNWGEGTITVSGRGTIVATGRITVEGELAYQNPATDRLALVSLSDSHLYPAISLTDTDIPGLIYASQGAVKLDGADVFGSVVGNPVVMSGDSFFGFIELSDVDVTYDENLGQDTLPVVGSWKLTQWQEQ